MEYILNDFYKNSQKTSKNKILNKSDHFDSYKLIPPDIRINKSFNKKDNKLKFLKIKHNPINNEGKTKIFDYSMLIKNSSKLEKKIQPKNNMNKLISYSINNNFSKNSLNSIDNKINGNISKNKSLNNSFYRLENSSNKMLNQKNSSNSDINHFHSTKNLISLKSINEKMIENKVNNIVDHLLLENKKDSKKENYSMINFPLNKTINPRKYIEIKLKKEPYDKDKFYSFNEQVKSLGNKKLRNYLIDGIDDYSQNIKKYNKINFDFFALNNHDNKKSNQVIKNIIIGNKNKNFVFGNKSKTKKNKSIKKSLSQYDLGFQKFKLDYMKTYRDKKFNFSIHKKIYNRNEYLKLLDNKAFYKMISVEDKINSVTNSLRKTGKIIGKNTYKIILQRDSYKQK